MTTATEELTLRPRTAYQLLRDQERARCTYAAFGWVVDRWDAFPAPAREYIDLMAEAPPTIYHVGAILGVNANTLQDRCVNRGLPGPKALRSQVRLVHAAYLVERHGATTATRIADYLGMNKRSFSRLVALHYKVCVEAWRRHPELLEHERRQFAALLERDRRQWALFDPRALVPGAVFRGRVVRSA